VSSLTEQERIGLEEVFLSISSTPKSRQKRFGFKKKLRHFRRMKPLVLGVKKPANLLNMALKRIKFSNFRHLLPKKNEKKKNLS
jgi:hypothetical protein